MNRKCWQVVGWGALVLSCGGCGKVGAAPGAKAGERDPRAEGVDAPLEPPPAPGPITPQQKLASNESVEALRNARFTVAQTKADALLAVDPSNPYAHLVSAVSRFRATMHQVAADAVAVAAGMDLFGVNHRYMRFALEQSEKELAAIDFHLAQASRYPDVSLDLCLACWKVDWNHDGRINDRDRRLLEIELDEKGEPLDEDDPRRRPAFRFDYGDVLWARAFVSFERAAMNVLLAYDFGEIDKLARLAVGGYRRASDEQAPSASRVTFRMVRPERVAEARRLIVAGLTLSDHARKAYLAETDDLREWVPNPRQKDHPLPLPVDGSLFETWEQVVGDLLRLVKGEEGLSVAEAAQLGEHKWEQPPTGYLNVGGMLAHPKDIVIEFGDLEALGRSSEAPEKVLKTAFGEYYVPSMKASPLFRRMGRMKREIDTGHESFERKVRYLLWLN